MSGPLLSLGAQPGGFKRRSETPIVTILDVTLIPMPLSRNVISQKGKRLTVITDFGYGWREYDPQRQAKVVDVPANFDFVVEEFPEIKGEIVAVLGRVSQPGHFLDGLELCAMPVPYVEVDFEERLGNYHLLVTPQRSHFTGTHSPPHYDSVAGSGYPEFRGYARSIRTREQSKRVEA